MKTKLLEKKNTDFINFSNSKIKGINNMREKIKNLKKISRDKFIFLLVIFILYRNKNNNKYIGMIVKT